MKRNEKSQIGGNKQHTTEQLLAKEEIKRFKKYFETKGEVCNILNLWDGKGVQRKKFRKR